MGAVQTENRVIRRLSLYLFSSLLVFSHPPLLLFSDDTCIGIVSKRVTVILFLPHERAGWVFKDTGNHWGVTLTATKLSLSVLL